MSVVVVVVFFSLTVDVIAHGSLSGSWDMKTSVMAKTRKMQIARSRNSYKV